MTMLNVFVIYIVVIAPLTSCTLLGPRNIDEADISLEAFSPSPHNLHENAPSPYRSLERPKKCEHCSNRSSKTAKVIKRSIERRQRLRTKNFCKKSLSCAHVDGYHEHRLLNLVTGCPSAWKNETTRHHCQVWEHIRFDSDISRIAMLPVQDSQGIVYANVFCAVCNDVDTVYPWTASMECDSTKSVFNLSKDEKKFPASAPSVANNFTDISFLMDIAETIGCQTKIIPAFPDVVRGCSYDRILDKYTFLRMKPLPLGYGVSVSPTVSFNLLINFDFKGDSHILFSSSQQVVRTEFIRVGRCEEGETYDTFHDRCRPIKCNQPFYRLVGDSCVLDERYRSEDVNMFDNPYFDEKAVLSLAINITLGSFFELRDMDNLNQVVREQIADSLGISEDRIRHTNVTFGFQWTNGTKAEIHRLDQLTPELKQKLHIEGWDLDQYAYDDMDEHGSNRGVQNRHLIIRGETQENMSKKTDSTKNDADERPDNSKTEQNIDELIIDMIFDKNQSNSKETGDKGMLNAAPSPSQNNPSTHDSRTRHSGDEKEHRVQTDTGTESEGNTTSDYELDFSPLVDFIASLPMTMYISFILTPAQHPKVSSERTTVLIGKISHLIRNNSLHISIRGEQLNVSSFDNTNSFEETNDGEQFCPQGRRKRLVDDKFQIVDINGTIYLHSKDDDTYYKQGLFNFFAKVTGQNNNTQTSLTHCEQFSIVCVMPRITHADCRRIELMADEYEVNPDNKTIRFQEKEYNMSMYTIINATSGLVEICVPQSYGYRSKILSPGMVLIDSKCGSRFEEVRRMESYLTMILGRISTIALVLVFVTYCLFSALRTLPGCNIMNLSLALFLAEFVFIEDIFVGDENLCAVVTITLHYLFLVAHFWMNAISFDVYRTFSRRKRAVVSRQDSVGKRSVYFPRYFLYAWGSPLVIVVVCIFIQYSNLFGDQLGYTKGPTPYLVSVFHRDKRHGSRGVNIHDQNETTRSLYNASSRAAEFSQEQYQQHACWIQNPVVNLLAFGAPILLIFLTNCAFFAKTILSVSRTVKMARENINRQESRSSMGKRSGRSEASLYLRMSTLMGFTWVFGFSSAIISSVARATTAAICTLVYVNSILFTIFNISQGVFIFVAFLCNRRVLLLYVKLFFRLRRILLRKSRTSMVYSISSGKGLGLRPE